MRNSNLVRVTDYVPSPYGGVHTGDYAIRTAAVQIAKQIPSDANYHFIYSTKDKEKVFFVRACVSSAINYSLEVKRELTVDGTNIYIKMPPTVKSLNEKTEVMLLFFVGEQAWLRDGR